MSTDSQMNKENMVYSGWMKEFCSMQFFWEKANNFWALTMLNAHMYYFI